MDLESILQRSKRVPSADSASKVIHHMQRSGKMLRAGHGLTVDSSIQRHFRTAPTPTALYSDPSFSLFKLVDKRPLPEPRGSLFDICTSNFHYALPVDAVVTPLGEDAKGQLLSKPVPVQVTPAVSEQAQPTAPPPAVPETKAKPPEPHPKPLKQKEKKEKKDKEKKEKKDKKEKREKKDKREKGDKKEKKDKDKKRKRSVEAPEPAAS